ncbi:MAG: hypothetical protein Ct9H300mP1_33230 [Planctomycetaceae bacterium]|nr:MAG: hypothetical protein Ct9H300mP1_33230 [Planctomycetaceae bacterium]
MIEPTHKVATAAGLGHPGVFQQELYSATIGDSLLQPGEAGLLIPEESPPCRFVLFGMLGGFKVPCETQPSRGWSPSECGQESDPERSDVRAYRGYESSSR